jgi:hypothetical protein
MTTGSAPTAAAASTAIPWGRVHHTAERIAIIGSGPSLRDVQLHIPAGITVIAVNAAVLHLPRAPEFWFTLDPSVKNRALMAAPREGTIYYAAVLPTYGQPGALPRHHRSPPEPHVIYLRRIDGPGNGEVPKLSEKPDQVHHGNSMWGALQLGAFMEPRAIALLGLDARENGYAWGDGQPSNLSHLPDLFRSALPQLRARGITVVNGSPLSRVDCFDRTSPQDALAWLAAA